MTAQPWQLSAEPFEAGRKYALEAFTTFCLLLTVAVAIQTANPFAALGIGVVLLTMVCAGSEHAGVHGNPAITLAAMLRNRIPMHEAVGYWCAQLVAVTWVGLAWRVVVGPTANAMTLSPRTLMAAMAAELAFTFVLSYVVLICVERSGRTLNKLADLAIGTAVLVGVVDLAAVFGVEFLVVEIIAGALAAIAFLATGSVGR